MSQQNIRRLLLIALAFGLAAVAAYLDTHGDHSTWFLWFGVLAIALEM